MIAVEEAFPVGAAWYRLFRRDQPGYGFVDERTPELAIAVVPSKRGHGIGEQLLTSLIERARESGYDALSLSVEPGNPARKLYERHGFRCVQELPLPDGRVVGVPRPAGGAGSAGRT